MDNQSNGKKTLLNEYFAVLLVVGISILFVCFTFLIFDNLIDYREIVNWNYAYSIGGTLALGYQIIFLISGGWSRSFYIFLERWKDFFDDIKISFKFAITSFFENIFNNGVVFLLYLFVLLSTLNMCVHGFQYLITLYGL